MANLSAPSTAVSTLHYLLTRTNVPCVTRVLFTTEISGAPKCQQEKKTDPVKKLIYIFLKLFLTVTVFHLFLSNKHSSNLNQKMDHHFFF